MHHHTLFAAAAASLAALARPSFALPTTTGDALYARQTAPTASHIEAPGLQVQGQAEQAAPSVYEGKYKGTSFYTDSDCSSPRYIALDPATLLRQHRSLVCDGRGHLHHMDPLHLSFTLPAATAASNPSKAWSGHKHEGAHQPSLKKLQSTQFDTCKRSCLTTPTCMSFSYNAWDRVCNLYSVSLVQQGFIDWREQEADPSEGASHAVWSDVAFWDADCYVRVCSAYEGEEEPPSPDPIEGSGRDAENTTDSKAAEEDEGWMLGERLDELRKPRVEAVVETIVDERRVSKSG